MRYNVARCSFQPQQKEVIPIRMSTNNQMQHISITFRIVPLLTFAVTVLATLSPQEVVAQWTNLGNVNGIQAYRDERSGLEWTVTIGQVQSSGWGAPARALVAKYGFRLPSFRELQVMEANGGFRLLNIRTTMQQYYETSNSNVLGAAWGNGFRTPQQRQGRGMNWVIGVRDTLREVSAEPVFGDEPPIVSKPTASTPSVSPSEPNTSGSNAGTLSTTPVLPTLPSYDD